MLSRFAIPAYRRLLCFALVSIAGGCGGSAQGVPSIGNPNPLPHGVASLAAPAAVQHSLSNPVPAAQSLCVGGTLYTTAQDDEFSHDRYLNYSSQLIYATPQPNGAVWSSRANGFQSDNSRNNIGADDAYYTDPSRGFGGYNPYSLSGGGVNLRAEPVPSPYATAPALDGAHWLSGLLESRALTYGYVEVSAKVPNTQGFWPSLWVLGLYGADGKGNGYEELDMHELFGNLLPKSTVQQTQIFSPSGQPPANWVRTVVAPDPSTSYHTYAVLWTPQYVRFYIDRVQRSAAFANAANGPANAILNLSVFAQKTWAAPPPNGTPEAMNVKYFRWYQSVNTSCSPTIVPTSM